MINDVVRRIDYLRRKYQSVFFLILCMLLVSSDRYEIFGQKFPDEYHISTDGRRLIRGNKSTEGLYNINTIDTLRLNFSQTDFWSQLSKNYHDKKDIPATLKYKGITYDSIGVRFKGQTSYMMTGNRLKKSINLTLDFVHKKQKIEGYKTLNLNNACEDPSFLREFLYNDLGRKHIPSAKTNFVVLYINDQCRGLYVNVQQLDKKHGSEWFFDKHVIRWRAESKSEAPFPPPPGFQQGNRIPYESDSNLNINVQRIFIPPNDSIKVAQMPAGPPPFPDSNGRPFPPWLVADSSGEIPVYPAPHDSLKPHGNMFGAGKSSLNYLGSDPQPYMEAYDLKKTKEKNPWKYLINTCYWLNEVSDTSNLDTLWKVLDIDGTLWFLAHEILFTDDDSYVWKGGMDYYVYYDRYTGRIVPVEYDGNSTFSLRNASQWSPFLRQNDTSFVLMNRLFEIPELKQRYLAHVRTILEESLNSRTADSLISVFAKKIAPYVKNDTVKLYSTELFYRDVETLKKFIRVRNAYLNNNEEINRGRASIEFVNFTVNGNKFRILNKAEPVTVQASVKADSGIKNAFLYFGTGYAGPFNRTPMYDDGLHQDQQAHDGIYGAVIPEQFHTGIVRFYIEAVVNDEYETRSYCPEGAEHDVFFYQINACVRTKLISRQDFD